MVEEEKKDLVAQSDDSDGEDDGIGERIWEYSGS